jgi:hypothetical protein
MRGQQLLVHLRDCQFSIRAEVPKLWGVSPQVGAVGPVEGRELFI